METLPPEALESLARFHELRLMVLKMLLSAGGDQIELPAGDEYARERQLLEAARAQVSAYETEHGPIDITEYIS